MMLPDTDNNPDNNYSAEEIPSEEDICKAFGGRPDISQLNFFALQFSDAMQELEFYFDTLLKFFKDQEASECEHVESRSANIPESRKGQFWENNYPYHWENIFEGNLKSSFVVSLLTCLEVYLLRICLISGSKDTFGKLIDKPKCGFPYKYCDYLSEHLKIDFQPLEWDQIERLWQVRNAIAHNDGLCLKKKRLEELRKFVDNVEGISMVNFGTNVEPLYGIDMSPSFCKSALDIVRQFGLELRDLIRDHLTTPESD